ncbi:hypothetical protein ATY36_13840, partial [Vibrio cidicii]
MTVTIRTFPNKLDRTLFEVDTFPSGQSLNDILQDQIPNFRVMATPPIEVLRNGLPFAPLLWDQKLVDGEELEITVRPRDPVTLAYAVIAAVVAGVVVANSMAPPDNYSQTTPDGSPIYDVNAQGNQVRMMGVVPELFGTHGTFPCLVNPAHRYYYNDDEYLLLMNLVSRGYLALTQDDIQIGNTPISSYAGDIDIQIKDPGDDVTAHPAWLNVYTSPEVGSTSGGGSGIELEGAVNSVTPVKTKFTNKTLKLYRELEGVAVPYWPIEWEVGHVIVISGTQGSKTVSPGDSAGGFRGYYPTSPIEFWSTDEALHDCRYGDYIRYPISYTESQNGAAQIEYATGYISSTYVVTENNVEFYAVRIKDGKGMNIPNSAVPVETRQFPLQFLGKDDGRYKITDRTSDTGTVEKMFPDAGEMVFSSFFYSGDIAGARFTAEVTLPGKPVGPFYACPVNELTNEIHVDLKFPEGIGYLNDNGTISSRELRVMLQWREDESNTWKEQVFKRSGNSRDQMGNTVRINLGKYCRPQFRAYRITGESNDTRTWDTIELIRLKSVLESKASYQDGTTLAVRIRGTNALSRSAENKLFCVPTRLLHVPNGQGGWTGDNYNSREGMVATNDLAPVLRYICHEIGLDDNNIGQDELLRLHSVWQERGDHFAAQFDKK